MEALSLSILSCLVSLAGLWWLFFWLYPDYRADAFREEMFLLRDELFREATNGTIDFNHPAYGLLRSTMNGFIRFGHQISIAEFVLWLIWVRPDESVLAEADFSFQWKKATADLRPGTLRKVVEIRDRMNIIAVKHAILNSPLFLLTVILPLAVWMAMLVAVQRCLSLLRVERLDSVALAAGS